MIGAALFRRRQVWLPTIWGGLLLLLLAAVTCVLVARNIHSFLAPNDPIGAQILVVEGWLAPDELDQAVQAFQSGSYQRVITTGGPIRGWPELIRQTSYAQMAADHLVQHGVAREKISVIPAPESAQDRTFLSAVIVREAALRARIPLDAIDLFSSGTHARRSRLLFQMALGPNVRVGVLAARPADYTAEAWWRTSRGTETVVVQSLAFLWAKLFFWPGPPGSEEERWAAPGTGATGGERM